MMPILVSDPEHNRVQKHLGDERYSKLIATAAQLPEEQCVSISNALNVFEQILKLNLSFKQKSDSFDPSKRIRFNASTIPNLEIWLSYTPAPEPFSKDDTHKLVTSVDNKLDELFPAGALRDALVAHLIINPMYLNEINWKQSVRKLQSKLITQTWFLGRKIDFPSLFPKARRKPRSVHIFAGETSSGKTYQALLRLKKATSGAYVGPLRLNALEVYDELSREGIVCDLLTGEEKLIHDGATHQASTVELMPYHKELECVVIDEAQQMDDHERGHSFVSSILGAAAKEICVTCPPWAVDKIKELCEMLGDKVEVTLLERKTKLVATDEPAYELPTEKGSAIVAFSRKRIFQIRKMLPKDLKVAILYGGMPPEVRREQARRFREGEADVLLSTDCIGLGLNLPIQYIVLDSIEKYDGTDTRPLTQAELLQIVGRAGRYGIYEVGYVAGTSSKAHVYIKRMLEETNHTEMLPRYYASVPFYFVNEFMTATGIPRASSAMGLIYENLSYDKSVYDLTCIDVVMDVLIHVENNAPTIELSQMWSIAHMPIDVTVCERVFDECLQVMVVINKLIELDENVLGLPNGKQDTLFELERLFSQIDCVRWFYNRFPEHFEQCVDPVYLEQLRKRAEKKMNDSVVAFK